MRFYELLETVSFDLKNQIVDIFTDSFKLYIDDIISLIEKKRAWKQNPSEKTLQELMYNHVRYFKRMYTFYKDCRQPIENILNKYLEKKYPGYQIKLIFNFVQQTYGYYDAGGKAIPGKRGKTLKIEINFDENRLLDSIWDIVTSKIINNNFTEEMYRKEILKSLPIDIIIHELEHIEQNIKSNRKVFTHSSVSIKSKLVQKYLKARQTRINANLGGGVHEYDNTMISYLAHSAEIDAYSTSIVSEILTGYDKSYLQDLYLNQRKELLNLMLSNQNYKDITKVVGNDLKRIDLYDEKEFNSFKNLLLKKIYKKLVDYINS